MEQKPTITPTIASLHSLHARLGTLVVYRRLFDSGPAKAFRDVLDWLDANTAEDLTLEVIEGFSGLQAELLEWAAGGDPGSLAGGDLWQAHLIDRVLWDQNSFSLAAERYGAEGVPPSLLAQAAVELRLLHAAYRVTLAGLRQVVAGAAEDLAPALRAAWTLPGAEAVSAGEGVAAQLADAADWGALAGDLAAHYAADGCGVFGRYTAFRWVGSDAPDGLEPVPAPDAIRLANLVAYDRERELVISNTQRFVLGAPGNNVLLYGDAGTGKSSLVKALLNEYAGKGLRLIDVSKERLSDFPHIAAAVRNRRHRFILFVDDLSFEEDDNEYKALKALLEGGVQARPENMLIYATSNRRHLVKESHADRSMPGSDEVHPHETAQEKVSLSERFGIRVAFLSPELSRYNAIVEAIARDAGLTMDSEELRKRALVWAQWQNGFSGRTARQFVNDLLGEQREQANS